MASSEVDTTYYSLDPLGFPGWEHTEALRNPDGFRSFFLRRTGDALPGWTIRARDTLSAVRSFIENHDRWAQSHEEILQRWRDEVASQAAGRARCADY